jgi:DNA topoisomerase-1
MWPMSKPLVIVESPAKAKTIATFLGGAFDVRASIGHVADLPKGGMQIDVDNGFKPNYQLTDRGKDVVKDLKAALKNASELYLATDEDREGEAISWHLVEALKPTIPVKRMVFHEITKAAIDHAVKNPRAIHQGLVDAAETRRLLDRLYGYEVSPVLWRRVNPGLSAGRVQSPAVRLVVEREHERIRFVRAPYWDVVATSATAPAFTATLVAIDSVRVATGKDFGDDGQPRAGVVVVDQARAERLAAALPALPFAVRSVDQKPYRSSPKPPFMTSTLQQEGGRKLRLSAQQVMRLAQGLYERGFITYMRTDSVALSDEALTAVRTEIRTAYGPTFVAAQVRQYTSKIKNAQEAHEAIRPTTPLRAPDAVASEMNGQELALYRMIWQRTLASQMADAAGTTVSVRLGATVDGSVAEFAASGTTITFQGYRRVYVESADQEASDGESGEAVERLLPPLEVGGVVPVASFAPVGHETVPRARYTEASLVKRLEELGIGRPSTWASILQTVQDRGYVWKKGQALVPTWTAFAVVRLMEQHFDELVDYAFTAKVEEDLDSISRNERQKSDWLERFYFGSVGREAMPGLKRLVADKLGEIDAAQINTFVIGQDPAGVDIVVKPGKYAAVRQARRRHGVACPTTCLPTSSPWRSRSSCSRRRESDVPIGEHEGLPLFAKNGRYGPYVQWGTADAPPPGLEKPKMSSLFKTMALDASPSTRPASS